MNKDKIDVKIENGNNMTVSYTAPKDDALYAFYLLLDKEIIERASYSEIAEAEFQLEIGGKYKVKIYERKEGEPVETIFTDPVFVRISKKKYKGPREVVVEARNVTKKFRLYKKTSDKLKSLFSFNKNVEYHLALKNISFEALNGEVIGIIGVNGSGKSTLSNLLAGISTPTEGILDVKGKALMLGVGTGMNSNLTGLENIKFKCLMMGLSEAEIKEITPAIIEFAELGKFIDQPMKAYSSGMKARLGFAISANVDPDILIIDEALSVGDERFTQRCLDKIQEFVQKGKTIFFVSHSASQMRKFCSKAIWLHEGRMMQYGEISLVIDEYQQFLKILKDYKRDIAPDLRTRIKYRIYAIKY